MKGVAARYPAMPKDGDKPIDLEGRIRLCRTANQQAEPLAPESRDLLSLTAFVANQSRGLPIAPPRRRPADAVPRAGGRDLCASPGPAQPVLRHLPRRQCRQEAGRRHHPGGPSDRLSDLPPGMAGPGLAQAAAAQLSGRRSRRGLSVRGLGICRPRGLPDGSGEGHDIRVAGRKALTESCILMRAYPSSTTQALRLRRRSFLAGLTVAAGTTTAAVAQQSGLKFAHRRRRRRLRRLWQRLRRCRQMGEPEDRRKARDDPRQPGQCPVARSGHGRHRSGVRRDDSGTFQSQGWAANPAQGDNHRLFEPRHVRRAGR